jgi:hypothetical protein
MENLKMFKKGKYSKMEMEHVAQMKKHGVPKKFVKQEEKEAKGMKKGGMAGCYAAGGTADKYDFTNAGRGSKPKAYAAGGMVRADGCASKGKTRGRFV